MKKIELLIIIPARKNSSGLKNKNLRIFNKKILILHSYEFAKKIKINKFIFISTDSKKIKNIFKKSCNFHLPILRPKKYSKKYSRDLEFVNHALQFFSDKDICFKNCLILRPTSPIRSINNFYKAYNLFKKHKCDSLKSIYPSIVSPYKSWKLKNNYLKLVAKTNIYESFNAPRQILPKTYNQTGGIEVIKINYKKKIKSISGSKILGFVVSKKESLDIDTINDLRTGENFTK
jgi:CMP-N,N'-diacetyllegionaminic acid synthase